MYRFVNGIYNILNNKNNAALIPNQSSIFMHFVELNTNMAAAYNRWVAFVDKVSTQTDNQGNPVAAIAQSAKYRVTYPIGQMPNSILTNVFGNELNAKSAAQYLLQMVTLTYQALASIQQSPSLVALLNNSVP